MIQFVDPQPGRGDPLAAAFASKEVSQRLRDYVCCRLYQTHEPDRRYVGQYNVRRAPAVIVVRPDQTYHAQEGRLSSEELLAFLDQSNGPGRPADLNPHIRRQPVFDWHDGFAGVQNAVSTTGRSGFVIIYRRFTADRRRLESMIESHAVYARVADMVHGRVAGWNRWARTRQTPYGEVKLPAVVLIRPDGGHHVLEMPASGGEIAGFADRSLALSAGSPVPAENPAESTASAIP